MDLRAEKALLRRSILNKRDLLPVPERMYAAERAAKYLLSHPRLSAASTVLLYLTFRSEVPTEPLVVALAEAGKTLVVPHMTSGVRALAAAEYVPGDALEIGPYGVSQPVSLRPVAAASLDVIVAPGAAFDRTGIRMGYGKGYYDRFLSDPELNSWVVGLAFSFQVRDLIPLEPHDRRMDAIVTEVGITEF